MESKDTVQISKEEYYNLLLDSEKLNRLECGGVDNWSWYGDALNPEGEVSFDDFEQQLKKRIFDDPAIVEKVDGIACFDPDKFDEFISNSKVPVLVDFFAQWCGPCKMLSPIMHDIGKTMDNVLVTTVDIDVSPEITTKYGITSVPTVLIFKDGNVVERVVGVHPKQHFLDIINKIQHRN